MRILHASVLPQPTRREVLSKIGGGFGLIGLASLLSDSVLRARPPATSQGPLETKPTHFPAKAKHVIFLFLNGGLSHIDTFDPKPMLDRYHGQPMPGGNPETSSKTGNLLRSPFSFKKYGQSGIEVSEIFPQVAQHIDDICVIRSLHTNLPVHESSLFMINCGDIQPGRPSMGSWITYGLGTRNQNLPGFVVLCPGTPVIGPPLWSATFLPAVYQGTHINNKESDPGKLIEDIRNGRLRFSQQRRQLDLLTRLNRAHLERLGEADSELEASIASMEIAFRMQTEAPEVLDLSKESQACRERYGEGEFGRACLMALRLVERGVRVVQVYSGNGQPWDSHEDIFIHAKLAQQADRAIAALLKDLADRGLLKETLVICGTEFGRTPSLQTSAEIKVQNGRDHNHYGFTIWLAGGGVKGGMVHGATDEFGFKAVENPVHVHDLHATILHLLGLDHTRLTYHYSGRNFRLTDVEGKIIDNIIA